MSRAVIDQSGFRFVFIGIVISLVLGLTIKSQITQKKIQAVIQKSLSRLDKDFIIDFKTAEVKLSSWGLPNPFLEITQIRLSPKKATCHNSQLYIENLSVPLSLISLITSKSTITEISASIVELRIAEFDNCLKEESATSSAANSISESTKTTPTAEKNIFQLQTAALLEKVKIDQLKLIFKNFPKQALELRQVQLDLSYLNGHLSKILLNSKVNALKDSQSNLVYFRGDLGLQLSAGDVDQVNAEAKLNGQFIDGQVQAYFFYDAVLKKLKSEYTLQNISLKPLKQLSLTDSFLLNYPVALSFQGLSEIQFGKKVDSRSHLKNIQITGDRIFIEIPDVELQSLESSFDVSAFEADIKQLNLNKLENLSSIGSVAPSVENFGEFSGRFKFENKQQMGLQGSLSNFEFIFSNRGRREILKVDNLEVLGSFKDDAVQLKLSNFSLNNNPLTGGATIQHNIKSFNTQAEAQLSGKLLSENIWTLLTETTQNPDVKLHWVYKKADQERHQIYLYVDSLKSKGIVFEAPEMQMLQSISGGISSGLALTIKVPNAFLDASLAETDFLKQLFNPDSVLNDKMYSADHFVFNLKGVDWKNMTFDMETKLKPSSNPQSLQTLKAKGEWKEDESVEGLLTIQSPTLSVKRFQLLKKTNSPFSLQAL